MDIELIFGFIGFLVWFGCMVVFALLLLKMYDDNMKKHYTIQIDDKVFVDVWALRISKIRRLVVFEDLENGIKVERYMHFDELRVMMLVGEKNEK